jgi:signal transduction histidine kinase
MAERVRGAGGTIDFESRPGAGSRVVVRIPFDRPGRTDPTDRSTAT